MTPNPSCRRRRRICEALCAAILILAACEAGAQRLRFSAGYRELVPPDYASLKIGPFYSSVTFSQTAEYRYSAGKSNVVDVLQDVWRGKIKKDGSELPLVSTLTFRNYLPISRRADMDASFWVRYEHYPLDTQDDAFTVNFMDQDIQADVAVGYASRLTPYIRTQASIHPSYSTDYIDLRGKPDEFGGRKYERFENTIGMNIDVLLKRNMGLGISASRVDTMPQGGEFSEQKSTGYSIGAGLEYEVSPLLMLGFHADYGMTDYPDSENDGFFSAAYHVSANMEFSRELALAANFGYSDGSLSSTNPLAADTGSGTLSGSLSYAAGLSKSLSHSIGWNRGLSRGFQSGIEVSDAYSYGLKWEGDLVAMNLSARLSQSSTQGSDLGGYSAWELGYNASVPLSPEMVVSFSSTFSRRENKLPAWADKEGLSAELTNDYDTWSNTIATSRALAEDLAVRVYAQYVLRESAEAALGYGRFVTGIACGYTHEF